MSDIQKQLLYVKYRRKGMSHLAAIRKVLADERLPDLISALTSI